VLYFSVSATTTQLLSSSKFRQLPFDTIPVKSASASVPFYTSNSKCQILSFDTLVANERYNIHHFSAGVFNYVLKFSHVLDTW
jgi:hypothetical protein